MKPERIGLLLIHGIGDQPRGEHLRNITEALAWSLRREHGAERVTVTANSPFPARGDITIIVSPSPDCARTSAAPQDRVGMVIDIREAWWRDLAENPTMLSVAKFWWWAMTFCAARKDIPQDNSKALAPTSPAVRNGRVSLFERMAMFAKTTAFFVILLPVHVAFQVIAIFPMVQRIHFLRTVFAYLNSVRLYQEQKASEARIVENLFQCRRLSILKRAVDEAVFFATHDEFDRWYVMGHSLGSVVAHNLVNLCPQAISRLRPEWPDATRPGSPFFCDIKRDSKLDSTDQNMPEHPAWFPEAYGIDPDKFFERMRGLITYGSPLETFARFWPRIVMTRRDARVPEDFRWINIYDPMDIVAAEIKSLPPIGHAAVENICVSTHGFFLLTHTSYLSRKAKKEGQRIAHAIGRHLIGLDQDLFESLNRAGVVKVSARRELWLRRAMLVQALLILCAGSVFLPRIVASIGAFFVNVGNHMYELVARTFTNWMLADNCSPAWICGILQQIGGLDPLRDIFADMGISTIVIGSVFLLLLILSLLGRLLEAKAENE